MMCFDIYNFAYLNNFKTWNILIYLKFTDEMKLFNYRRLIATRLDSEKKTR